jgi:general secretion pathway protein H
VKTRAAGFTLIELLVVVALIAIASGVASLALRDPAATRLEREATRLVALLEAARAEARASGLAVHWAPRVLRSTDPSEPAADFVFAGLPPSSSLPSRWLGPDLSADVVGARAVILGPEPMIGAQRIVLRLNDQRITLQTDGLGPFAIVNSTPER